MTNVARVEETRRQNTRLSAERNARDLSPFELGKNLLNRVVCELKGYRFTKEEIDELQKYLDDIKFTVKCMEEGL